DHLERIINDILDFSKLQDGKMPLEKVHFSIIQIFEEVYAMFEAQAAKNNSLLSYSAEEDIPSVLIGDPYRLKQIMINLVSNSVKFTRDGTVNFSASAVRKPGQEIGLVMKFTDSGIGIDESKLDFIFEDFTQAEMSTTRRYGGTGLGLSIVKKLVDLHNGSIDFKSRKNQGTVITCIIPCQIGDKEQLNVVPESPLLIPERIRDLYVLVVDDEEYNRLLFSTILDRWGVRHDEAANGMEALEMVRTGRYNLLFMDIRMPGIDGIRATEFIRRELKIKASQLPVICITAASLNEDWHIYEKAGMNAFIPKPFTEKMLLSTILSVTGDDTFIPSGDAAFDAGNGSGAAVNAKVNLQNLYHLAGGDEDFVLQMLKTFIGTTATGLAEMKASLLAGERQKAGDIAHKLMPPCRHLGAVNLHILLREIEKNCTGNDNDDQLEELIAKTALEYKQVSALLNEHIEKIKPV
ncbi:MAG TPA: ATP-binding protein, partial [Bacteroidales bacterium]|nr:ATP-binding protein [Bacteroidales bacterium]